MNHCGDCTHWHAKDVNPLALGEKRGQCREGPPGVGFVPGADGRMVTLCGYPDLPKDFPACSRFVQRAESV